MVLSSTSSFTALPRSRPLPPLVESHVVERTNSNETLSGPQLEVDLSSVVSNIHSLDSITVLGATASVPPHITVPTVPIVSTTPNLPPQVVNHWTFWRLWCVVHGVFTLIIFSVEVVGLLDSTTCDSRIYNFTLAYAFILALNCLLSLLLFFILPKAPIWTHQNYLKAKLSTWVFTLQVVGIMSQLVMVPLGFAFMTKSDQTCRDTLLYRSNYGVLLGEIILFTLLTSPIFYVPCFLILTDIPPSRGISRRRMARLPSIIYSEESPEMEPCTICLDEFEIGAKVKKLGCGHVFHKECVSLWLREHADCPLCRSFA